MIEKVKSTCNLRKKKKKRKERGTSKKKKRKKERKKSQRLSVRYSIGSISGVNTKLRYIPVPVERIWYGKLRQRTLQCACAVPVLVLRLQTRLQLLLHTAKIPMLWPVVYSMRRRSLLRTSGKVGQVQYHTSKHLSRKATVPYSQCRSVFTKKTAIA